MCVRESDIQTGGSRGKIAKRSRREGGNGVCDTWCWFVVVYRCHCMKRANRHGVIAVIVADVFFSRSKLIMGGSPVLERVVEPRRSVRPTRQKQGSVNHQIAEAKTCGVLYCYLMPRKILYGHESTGNACASISRPFSFEWPHKQATVYVAGWRCLPVEW